MQNYIKAGKCISNAQNFSFQTVRNGRNKKHTEEKEKNNRIEKEMDIKRINAIK